MSDVQDHQTLPDPRQARRQGVLPPPDQHRMPIHRHTQDDFAYSEDYLPPPNANALMCHQNYSVPSFPSHPHPDDQQDSYPPMPPPYEATEMFDNFSNMQISDPSRGPGPQASNYANAPASRTACITRPGFSTHASWPS
ncbi:uncharacterized protein FIBRA_02176 [Fibroporia radiculosa]|uniref:Uncharacterized protein n=1 Tax=Fibroporia radiculosa TaxID=599839 RepID=J4H1P8_9APHY|nr:uncharacterized protein FIBRA_02176 [Fibroporia radiculosa]CCM00149.1 predicted protein [Fibroporia radiculosa]